MRVQLSQYEPIFEQPHRLDSSVGKGIGPASRGHREIKHRIYRKREREKYDAIMSFPPFFTFAIFNAKRAVLAFVNNASNFFEVFDSFCYN